VRHAAAGSGPGRLGPVVRAFLGPLVVVAVVLLTNLPGLVGIVLPNPLLVTSFGTSHVVWGFLPGQWFSDPSIGWNSQALSHLAAVDWLHGQIPWWNPFMGIGMPLAGQIQAGAFFPPVLLFALANGSLIFRVALEIGAGLATFFLLREVGMSRPVATVGAALFALNGTFSWLNAGTMNPVPLLPMLLLGVERIYRRPRQNAGWVIIALALALSIYGGFPETAYMDGLLGLAWALLRLGQSARGDRRRFALRLALGGGTGLLLALPVGLPFAELLLHADLANHALAIGRDHLGAIDLPTLGLPYLYGPIAAYLRKDQVTAFYWAPIGGFVTASTIAFGAAGLFGARRERGLRIMLAVYAVVMLLWVYGVKPFSELSSIVPVTLHIELTRYATPSWELCLIVLACFGLEAIGSDRRARVGTALGGCAALGLGALILTGTAARVASTLARIYPSAHVYTVGTEIWAGAIVVAVCLFGVLKRRRWTVAAAGVFLVLDAVAMAGLPQFSAPRSAVIDQAPLAFLRSHLGLGRYASFVAYHSDYGSYFGLAQIDTTALPVPIVWANEITRELGSNNNPIRFDGQQVINPNGPSAAEEALSHLATYRRLDVRYFVVHNGIATFGSRGHYLDGLRNVFQDQNFTILAVPSPAPYYSTTGHGCHLAAEGFDSVVVTCTAPDTLVRNELDYSGWAATVNGRPVPVLGGGTGLVTDVRLPAGRSVVVFSYAPPKINIALAGFALGALIMLGIPIATRLSRRRRVSSPYPPTGPAATASPQSAAPGRP